MGWVCMEALKRVPGDVPGGAEEDFGRRPQRDVGRSAVLCGKPWGCSGFLERKPWRKWGGGEGSVG